MSLGEKVGPALQSLLPVIPIAVSPQCSAANGYGIAGGGLFSCSLFTDTVSSFQLRHCFTLCVCACVCVCVCVCVQVPAAAHFILVNL